MNRSGEIRVFCISTSSSTRCIGTDADATFVLSVTFLSGDEGSCVEWKRDDGTDDDDDEEEV